MFRRRQKGKLPLDWGGAAKDIGRSRSPALAFRLTLVFFLLLSFPPLYFGIAVLLPGTPVGDSLQIVSDTWTRLLANARWPQAAWHLLDTLGPGKPGGLADPAAFTRVSRAPGFKARPIDVAPTREHGAKSPPPSPVLKSDEGETIRYGDRLKITFFESLPVSLSPEDTDPNHGTAEIYPRMDLSAEYAVDEGGSLNIPKLGSFTTTGQTITGLQSTLSQAFKRAIGRTSDVRVAIIERQPIYVVGTVRRAGSYTRTPGMVVLQALADAGGSDAGAADTSREIESIRESERLRQAEEKLDDLLVKRARLIAERDNLDSLVVPASVESKLSEKARHERLSAIIAGALATLDIERKSYQRQLSLAEQQVLVAQDKIDAQKLREAQLKTLLAKKTDKLHRLEAIAARGSVAEYRLTEANVEVAEIAARQADVRVAVAEAESRSIEAEIAKAKVELDHSIGIERELAATQQEIGDCARSITSMQAVIQVLHNNLQAGAEGSESLPNLSIMRRVGEGLTVIPATETTVLLPGDVVQVNYTNRSGTPAPWVADNMRRPKD